MGYLLPDDLSRFVFALKVIRDGIDPAPVADKTPTTIRVISVPAEHFIVGELSTNGARLTIEHNPLPEFEPIAEAPIESQSSEDEYADMSMEALAALAGVSLVDQS